MTPSQFFARLSLEAPMLGRVHKERGLMCTRQIVARLILNICRSLPVKLGGQNTYYYPDCSITRPEITRVCQSLILTMYAQCIVATWECYLLQALRAQFLSAFCTSLQFLRRIQTIQLVISLLHGLGFPFPPNIFQRQSWQATKQRKPRTTGVPGRNIE